MKVLIATCNQSIVGGIEKYLQGVIPALSRGGHQVAMLYEHPAGAESETVDLPEMQIRAWYWQNLREDPSGWREIAKWRPDVVYSHGPESLQLEGMLLDRYPSILYAHVYLGTCTTGRKCHVFPQMRPCERQFGPMCLALHYPCRCGGLNPLTTWKMFRSHMHRKSRLTEYRKILVASAHMLREYERNGVSPEHVQLLPYPNTDTPMKADPIGLRVPNGSILYVGRLTDLKGVDYLIRAVPKAAQRLGRPLILTVMGDGPERAHLQHLSQRLNVPVRFLGWLPSARKQEVLGQSDLLAVPSLWPEPFGLVGIEAGCLGVPAVGYAVGGIPDWLIGGKTGEIAPGDPPTEAGLADAIVRALADPNHYAQLCRGAWEHSRQYTMSKHVNELESVLESACHSALLPDVHVHQPG